MKTNIFIRKLTLFIIIFILTFLLLPLNTQAKGIDSSILLFKNTPLSIERELKNSFPGYEIQRLEDDHFHEFLKGADKTLAYDVEAKKLLESGANYHFYPLYDDGIVIAVDRNQTEVNIAGWEDLKDIDEVVSFPWNTPDRKYLWATISQGLSGKINKHIPKEYLRKIEEQNRLLWDDDSLPVQVAFASGITNQILEGRNLEVIAPNDTLTFEVGLLSRQPVDEEIIDNIKKVFQQEGGDFPIGLAGITLEKELEEMDTVLATLRRGVLGIRKHAPADDFEHQLASLFLIILILYLTIATQKVTIHPGIRKGLLLTGFILIGWISLGIFKYAIIGYSLLTHMSWYAFYLFFLPIPVISLYIGENSDKLTATSLSPWIKTAIVMCITFIILVLTNDYHNLIFTFTSEDLEVMGNDYGYGIGFTLLTIWFILTQVYAFFLMFKKGFDSPKKQKTILPIVIFLLGIAYSISYNMRIPLASEIPLVLGMCTLVMFFWVSGVYSGLIPNNRGYEELFQSSSLDMQIIDGEDNPIYITNKSKTLPEEILIGADRVKKKLCLEIEDRLYWITPIKGGKLITQEDIRELKELRNALEEIALSLEKENHILAEKERVESKLYILNEQNRIAREVYREVRDKLLEIESLIGKLATNKDQREKTIYKIQRLALYSKRKSELLVKSKYHNTLPGQELCRIIQETGAMMAKKIHTFCAMDTQLTFSRATNIYEYYHLICHIVEEMDMVETTLRLYSEEENFYIYIVFQEQLKRFTQAIYKTFTPVSNAHIRQKDLGDAYSITIELAEGGEKLDRAL